MISRFYCVLGGPSPGIRTDCNALPSNPGDERPPFPILVVCQNLGFARQVEAISNTIESLNDDVKKNHSESLYQLLQVEAVRTLLRSHRKFYVIVWGNIPAGIYLEHAYITSVFETEPRKTKKLDTFVDALTYLLTAGEFERAADFLAVYEDTLSHFSNLSILTTSSSTKTPLSSPSKSTTLLTPHSESRAIERSGSTSSGPTSDVQPIYQHIRSISGITGSVVRQPAVPFIPDASMPSFGCDADRYLQTHGYSLAALYQIEYALTLSEHSHTFINFLHTRGMAWLEAEYLWDLISQK